MTSKLKERATTVVFMLAATFVFTSAVSLTYLTTKQTIEDNERLFLQRAVLYAAGLEVPEDGSSVRQAYHAAIREVSSEGGGVLYYKVVDSTTGSTRGCVVPCEGTGLWGTISAVVGFDEDCRVLTGVDFTRQNETPGLGGRICEGWFREQFRGKSGPFDMVGEGEEDTKNQFDAITGATITSTAVRDMLNGVTQHVHEKMKGDE